MNKHNYCKFLAHGFLFSSICFYSVAGFSALDGDSYWLVEKGDSVYSIARKVFPDDATKQRQFRNELVAENPKVFNGKASHLNLGDRLLLPAFAVSKPVEVIAPVVELTEPVVEVIAEENVVADPEEVIGQVVISVGSMQASNRGAFRELERKSVVLRGDTLITSKSSYTQVRMKDGALISLRPNTELKFTDYRFNGKQDGSERSLMELARGGFRTITGYIGRLNKQNYRVKTTVATIGIRGTHYGLMICADGSCDGESTALEDGIYGGVVDGSIVVENESGITTFNNDQYFYIASAAEAPVEQLVPPPVFHGKNETLAQTRQSVKGANKGSGVKAKTVEAVKQAVSEGRVSQNTLSGNRLGSLVQAYVDNRQVPVIFRDQATNIIKDTPTISTAPIGSGALVSFITTNSQTGNNEVAAGAIYVGVADNAIVLGLNNLPIGFRENADVNENELILPSGVSGITDVGSSDLGVVWGRWSSDYVLVENGVTLPTFGDMHFIYSDNLTTASEMVALTSLGGLTSSETYSLAGNTSPTDAFGQTGTLVGLSVVSDFVNQQIVDYQVSVQDGVQGATFSMGATNVPFNDMTSFNLVPVGCTSCSGSAGAVFVGNQAQGLMTNYSMQDISSTNGVSGAAFLIRDSAVGTTQTTSPGL